MQKTESFEYTFMKVWCLCSIHVWSGWRSATWWLKWWVFNGKYFHNFQLMSRSEEFLYF